MTAGRTVIRGARVVTPPGPGPHRGPAMRQLRVLDHADVLIERGQIAAIRERRDERLSVSGGSEIDAAGRVLMPGFVDCHTHACWAGSRVDEWEQRLRGTSYLEILSAGGGILSTVRAVRAASEADLAAGLASRLAEMRRGGTTTTEIKSGYGLTLDAELKMLRVIRDAAGSGPARSIFATALLGHAIDPDVPDFARRTINETLPAVSTEFPGVAVDAFLEQGAWNPDDCRRLLAKARDLGHPLRLHADQFTILGGVDLAVELGARSVDHLEASDAATLARLADSRTIGVALPACGLHLDGRWANLRPLIDAGGAAAIATNCNPGSAPTTSMPLVIALAVRRCGLTVAEAITASTANAAAVLGLADRGYLAPGARADLVLLDTRDERDVAFTLGGDPVGTAWIAGERVK